MKKDCYVFPAVFECEEEGISIVFPDLPGCLPCGSTTEKAVKNAKEAMALHLYTMEQDGEVIPEGTPIEEIKIGDKQALILIEVYMPMYREAIENSYVRKNVTLPSWLEKAATEKGINYSQVLQNALKDRLGIKDLSGAAKDGS